LALEPSSCPVGKGYYFDSVPSPSVSTGWTNESTGVSSDNLPAAEAYSEGGSYRYRHRLTQTSSDIQTQRHLSRSVVAKPEYVQADLGLSLAASHNTNGLDSSGYSCLAGIVGFVSGSPTWKFGIFMKSRRVSFPKKTYTAEIRLVGNGVVYYSQTILNKQLEAADIPYAFAASFNFKVMELSPGTFEAFVDGASIGSFSDSDFSLSNNVGVELSQVSYASGDFQVDYGWADNFYAVGVGLPEVCLGQEVGIAHGFGGWISIFEDEALTGNSPILPQAIVVDQDNLKIDKEILIK
jgi:hypothetical protein